MEDLRDGSQSKPELNIKEFDDILTEILSNENMFNSLSNKIEKLESRVTEESNKSKELELRVTEESNKSKELELRVVEESNRVKELESRVTEESNKFKELELRVVEESNKFKELESKLFEKINTLEKLISDSLKKKITTPESIIDLPVEVSLPLETPIKLSTPIVPTELKQQDKCISNVLFTHQLHPIFLDQHSPNSKGTAVYQNGLWNVNLDVEILQKPPKSNIPEIPTGGYINYLNVQIPLNFSPKEIVSILSDRDGVLIKPEEAILGYIYYAPEMSVTYPHHVNINMILK